MDWIYEAVHSRCFHTHFKAVNHSLICNALWTSQQSVAFVIRWSLLPIADIFIILSVEAKEKMCCEQRKQITRSIRNIFLFCFVLFIIFLLLALSFFLRFIAHVSKDVCLATYLSFCSMFVFKHLLVVLLSISHERFCSLIEWLCIWHMHEKINKNR